MSAQAVPETPEGNANDRLKQSFQTWFWGSICIATVLHFAVFALWPDMTAVDVSFSSNELEAIELPPEIEIPPPPEQIARPATPVITEANIDEDITIAPTTFEDNPVEDLPPPPAMDDTNIGDAPTFTPFTLAPEIQNVREVQQALVREYPSILKDAGIGGTVRVWFFIDQSGRVQDTRVNESSGHRSLDEAALAVANIFRFSPAFNRDQRVAVWVQFPITFRTR